MSKHQEELNQYTSIKSIANLLDEWKFKYSFSISFLINLIRQWWSKFKFHWFITEILLEILPGEDISNLYIPSKFFLLIWFDFILLIEIYLIRKWLALTFYKSPSQRLNPKVHPNISVLCVSVLVSRLKYIEKR